MQPVTIIKGESPLILGQPHCGLFVPPPIFDALNDRGRQLADTDWHIDRLYDGVGADATVVRANFHRYVIDANRSASGGSLYPRANTTDLVPLTDFDGEQIWKTAPAAADIAERLAGFHAPYHAAMRAEIERVKTLHGFAILFDCHSIRSHIPFLFDSILPDFNIGTNSSASCAPEIERAVADVCARAEGRSAVVNGRFKGGWTTRHYGDPANATHAIQLEIAQSLYLKAETAPFDYDEAKAGRLRETLRSVFDALLRAAETL